MIFRVILSSFFQDLYFDFDNSESALRFLMNCYRNFVANDDCKELSCRLVIVKEKLTKEENAYCEHDCPVLQDVKEEEIEN